MVCGRHGCGCHGHCLRPLLSSPSMSMCSAIIEHTNQVIYLEDNDVASVSQGMLTVRRMCFNSTDEAQSTVREITTLKMQIQQIMKGYLHGRVASWSRCFMVALLHGCVCALLKKFTLLSQMVTCFMGKFMTKCDGTFIMQSKQLKVKLWMFLCDIYYVPLTQNWQIEVKFLLNCLLVLWDCWFCYGGIVFW